MLSFEVKLNSLRNPQQGDFERWTIPDDFNQFRTQVVQAFERGSLPERELWHTTQEALGKAKENWDYASPHFRDFWVRTAIDNMRSQAWCEAYDGSRAIAGENGAREQAFDATESFHLRFHG